MDNHLWVREDSVVDKLISCLESMWSCGWQTLVVQLVTCSLHFAAWWWIAVIDCSGWNVCPGSYYVCTGFWPHHRSLCFDTLLIFLYSNLKSLSQTNRKHMHRHTQVILGACWCICSHMCTRALTQGCQLGFVKKKKIHVNHQWHHGLEMVFVNRLYSFKLTLKHLNLPYQNSKGRISAWMWFYRNFPTLRNGMVACVLRYQCDWMHDKSYHTTKTGKILIQEPFLDHRTRTLTQISQKTERIVLREKFFFHQDKRWKTNFGKSVTGSNSNTHTHTNTL